RRGGLAQSYFLPRLIHPEDRPEDIADLAQGRLRSDGIQDRRHQVPLGPGFVLEPLKMGVDFPLAALPSECPQLADAFRFEARVRLLYGGALIALPPPGAAERGTPAARH